MSTMKEKKNSCMFCLSATEERFHPLNVFANYSKSKNMSVGKVCIKRFESACMTFLSPETVSIVLCQCSIMDIQVPSVPNQPKTAEISGPKRTQNALKTHIEATISQNFSRGSSPRTPLSIPPLVFTLFPLTRAKNHSRRLPPDHF